MVALVTAAQTGLLRELAEVAVVFSNHPEAPGLATASALACPTASLSSQGRKRADYDAEVVKILRQYRPDYVVLAGYMRILSPTFVRAFAGRILNIHPADTHQHQGLHAYEWAFDNQLVETKITVHLVDEGLDTGPILAQQTVDLRGAETLAEVERRGLAVEHQLYAKALAALIEARHPVGPF
ncbi:phosphoribosylglycinamide formyltransferase-1 [Hymenobacter psychrophilus]|uniref:phosphoribosylglycinamide formyltransferase 1 n=2 Tax=Hymenobacter psychrophilus TaxID=651662 RepID=A0A1H3F225_9BACT|nr:phosphoribosylglycinamide formyltransferase-1 [Hymenobacter psychrophilus]